MLESRVEIDPESVEEIAMSMRAIQSGLSNVASLQAARIQAVTKFWSFCRMSHAHAVIVTVSLSLGLLACSSDAESPPMGTTGTSGTAAVPPSTAGTTAAGAGATPAAGSTVPSAGSAGPATAGRGTPPAGGTAGGATTAGAPGGTAGASTAGSVATAGTSAAGAPGTAGMVAAGMGATAGTSGEGAPPATCAAGLTGKAGRTTERIEHAGVMRSYILYVPDSYKGDKPVPLMVNFHPLLTNSSTAENSSMWKPKADREGFIVAFPEGQESAAWNVGPCCTQSREVDDVGFTKALVAKIQSSHCVDAKRIYASGFSMGGGMAHYLACEAADLFAAVAPGHFDLLAENTCAPARPITVISFRSTSDFVVAYDGGVKQNAPNGFVGEHTFLGAVKTFEKWAEINGCTDQPMMESGGCQTHKQCKAGVEVTLCTVPGGHTWPDVDRSWQTVSRFSLP